LDPCARDRIERRASHSFRFSKQLDTSTPAREMVFTVLGAVAKLERGLIVERAKAGLRDTRAKGKRLGHPKEILDTKRIATFRSKSVGWKRIAADMGLASERSAASLYMVPKPGKRF
jgi:DNA invertase Pin-like site-specific DNA recombinase